MIRPIKPASVTDSNDSHTSRTDTQHQQRQHEKRELEGRECRLWRKQPADHDGRGADPRKPCWPETIR